MRRIVLSLLAQSNVSDLILPVGGFTGGAGFVYIFMRGTLNQMKAWKDIVVEKTNSYESVLKENKALHEMLEEHRRLLRDVRTELMLCEANRKIEDARHIETTKKLQAVEEQITQLRIQTQQHDTDHPTTIQGVIELKDSRN